MQAHTDMTRNQRAKCGIIDSSFLIVAFVLAVAASAGFAAQTTPAGKSIITPDEAETPAFPYFAEITGDNVNFRSGPGTNFYECGKFNKGDKVKVVSKRYSWYQIVPPAKSFSWISMQYVKLDPENPGFGILTGDRVRVYAGSDRIPPLDSKSLQGKLNKGEKVKLLGQQLDDYYKITPPPSAYLWVSTYFTKPVPPGAKVEPVDIKPTVKTPPVIKVGPPPDPKETDTSVAPDPVPAEVVPPKSRLEQYQALLEQIKAEKTKPIDKQDYKAINKALTEIVNDKEAGKAARYAQFVLKQVEGYELALAIIEKVRLQNELLNKKTTGIDETRTEELDKVEDLGRFAVTGKFETFTLYGAGNYRIVDDSGRMLCYALPSEQVSQRDLTSLIGQKVGIVGTIQPHLPTKKAMVQFSEIVVLN